jgi:hypothetical protein
MLQGILYCQAYCVAWDAKAHGESWLRDRSRAQRSFAKAKHWWSAECRRLRQVANGGLPSARCTLNVVAACQAVAVRTAAVPTVAYRSRVRHGDTW